MRSLGRLSGILLGWLLLTIGMAAETIENTFVQRSLSMTSQLLRETTNVEVKNIGSSPVSSYVLPFQHFENLAFLEVKEKKSGKKLSHKFVEINGVHSAQIDLNLKENESLALTISSVFSHILQASPKSVGQNEKQKMKFAGNVLFYSAYPTLKTKTVMIFPNEEITYTGEGLSLGGDRLTYGPVSTRVEPFSTKEAQVHFTHNGRFLTTQKLLRTLEVSHWGNNLAFEEFYDVIHDGAKLKGFYSRLDYDKNAYKHAETSVINSFDLPLPAGVSDIYYRDIIGNISTSRVQASSFETTLTLTPRFPLYGGWKTQWYHGYNYPLSRALKQTDDGLYVLTFDFVAPYDDAVIDELTLLITLPEGASEIRFVSDVDLQVTQTIENIQTYLDTYGRPILKITRKNVVDNHKIPVQVVYKFPPTMMLQEPLILFTFFFLLFVFGMLISRIDLSISKSAEDKKKEEAHEAWLDVVERIEAQKDIFGKLDDALTTFKKNKDKDQYKKSKDALDAEWLKNSQTLAESQKTIKSAGHSLASIVEDLKRISTEKWTKFTTAHSEIVSAISSTGKEKKVKEIEEELAKYSQQYEQKLEALLSR